MISKRSAFLLSLIHYQQLQYSNSNTTFSTQHFKHNNSNTLPSLRLFVICRVHTSIPLRVLAMIPHHIHALSFIVLLSVSNHSSFAVQIPSLRRSGEQLTLTYFIPVIVSGAFPFSTQSTIRINTLFWGSVEVTVSS